MNRIDLWLAYYDEFQHDTPRLLPLLSEEERAKSTCFHFADDRLRYIVTRAMVRTVLSRYASVAPKDWTFEQNAFGRPAIHTSLANLSGDLDFNLSHTRGLVALGVCRGRAVGVDVEHLERQPALAVAERYFSATESTELLALNPELQAQRFFEYWTLKESYVKAHGKGIANTLDAFSFHFPSASALTLTIDPKLRDDSQRWHFWQYLLEGDYLLAICVERKEKAASALRILRMQHMDAFEALPVQPIRSS